MVGRSREANVSLLALLIFVLDYGLLFWAEQRNTFGYCRGHDGHDPSIYGAIGDYLPANAEAHRPFGLGARDRPWRSGGAGEPLVKSRRDTNRSAGRRGADFRGDVLVGSVGIRAYAAAASFQSHEFGRTDARRRSVSGSHLGRAGRISRFSSMGRLARRMAIVALSDCRRLYHRV